MHTPWPRIALLALLLVFGQWLSFEHSDEHKAFSPSADQACEFCVHAQGVGAGLGELPQLVAVVVHHELPLAARSAAYRPAAPAHYPIRGPPTHA